MAVVDIKSTIVSNADADPRVVTNPHVQGGMLREQVATVEVAAADSDGSTYRMCRVPSGARITSIEIACDAITGGTAYDIGVYKTAADGGAAVDDDVFATAVDLSSALTWVDKTYEATATNIDAVEKRLWDLLGLSADPFLGYDIVLTADTVGTGAGTISLRVRYVL